MRIEFGIKELRCILKDRCERLSSTVAWNSHTIDAETVDKELEKIKECLDMVVLLQEDTNYEVSVHRGEE